MGSYYIKFKFELKIVLIIFLLLIKGQFLYSSALVSIKHQKESAIGKPMADSF